MSPVCVCLLIVFAYILDFAIAVHCECVNWSVMCKLDVKPKYTMKMPRHSALYYNYILFFNRGPRGRLAIIAYCVFLYKYCINEIKNKIK